MTVTKIEEVTKAKCRIEIDQEFAFVLYKGELRSYGLKEGQEITEEAYRDIMENLLPRRAKLRAMNLLKNRSYTEKQLYDKLKAGDYPEEIIEQALDYVRSYHYIDDRQYAEDYIEYHKESRSRSSAIPMLRVINWSGKWRQIPEFGAIWRHSETQRFLVLRPASQWI